MRPFSRLLACSLAVLPLVAAGGSGANAPQDVRFPYQYAAKIVCSPTRELQGLVPQQYATTINIHNPTDTLAVITKKVALTVPPGMQRPGKIIPLTRDQPDRLRPDEAMATDCVDVARRAGMPTTFEGFVVLYSSTQLDVVGVYTVPGGIDVVQVPERPHRGSF
jgi:hypothetical protein